MRHEAYDVPDFAAEQAKVERKTSPSKKQAVAGGASGKRSAKMNEKEKSTTAALLSKVLTH